MPWPHEKPQKANAVHLLQGKCPWVLSKSLLLQYVCYRLSASRGVIPQNGSSLTEEHMQLIQVLYRNHRGGPIDDITLDELIRSRKITHFYRASEERWVDIFADPVRGRDHAPTAEGLKRRYADREEDNQQKAREEKAGGLLRGALMRLTKYPPRKALSAEGWFERGLSTLRNTDDRVEAARAFALSIRLDPQSTKRPISIGGLSTRPWVTFSRP